jgi:hypothetical protein
MRLQLSDVTDKRWRVPDAHLGLLGVRFDDDNDDGYDYATDHDHDHDHDPVSESERERVPRLESRG